jgi:very-short-patch-repair endonuclease
LAYLGFQTLRFWNNDVLGQTDVVMEQIRRAAMALTPALSRRERE